MRLVLSSNTRDLPEKLFISRRRYDAEITVYPVVADQDLEESVSGTLDATLDENEPVLRLQTGGVIPTHLEGVLLLPPEEDSGTVDLATVPSRAVVVTGLGTSRAWVVDREDIPPDRTLVFRCALPGETESVEFSVRPRTPRADHMNRPVIELVLEEASARDLAKVVRFVTLYVLESLKVRGAPV